MFKKSHILTSSRFAALLPSSPLPVMTACDIISISCTRRCEIGGDIPLTQGRVLRSVVAPRWLQAVITGAGLRNPERPGPPLGGSPDGANLKLFLLPLHSSSLLGLRAWFFSPQSCHNTAQLSAAECLPLATRCILCSGGVHDIWLATHHCHSLLCRRSLLSWP